MVEQNIKPEAKVLSRQNIKNCTFRSFISIISVGYNILMSGKYYVVSK